ncbi:7TMR-DISMED2 domain-containing protein [Arsukibacterium indicum]|uniref:7TM-DISM receptor extracellular domain-containing protein n=1 Tax=Arsukibacterium indicum TaxID=2848612 RepID=A0ABS6MG36_9GAMM|nr:7TM-DISM domain-containing protein [Arsukibacterium indicum]MBV2127620.1 hypothetical protein [Arsukibacterium indicum]
MALIFAQTVLSWQKQLKRSPFRLVPSYWMLTILLLTVVSALFSGSGNAIDISEYKDGTPGKYIRYFQEDEQRLSLEQAQTVFASQTVKQASSNSLSLGIGTAPVWMKFRVTNPQPTGAEYRLAIETPWQEITEKKITNSQG